MNLQNTNTKEEDKRTIKHANVNKKSESDTRQKLIKNLEAEQQQISAQMKRVKVRPLLHCVTQDTSNILLQVML